MFLSLSFSFPSPLKINKNLFQNGLHNLKKTTFNSLEKLYASSFLSLGTMKLRTFPCVKRLRESSKAFPPALYIYFDHALCACLLSEATRNHLGRSLLPRTQLGCTATKSLEPSGPIRAADASGGMRVAVDWGMHLKRAVGNLARKTAHVCGFAAVLAPEEESPGPHCCGTSTRLSDLQ